MTIDGGSSSDNSKTSISLSSGSSGSRNIFNDWRYSRHCAGGSSFHLLLVELGAVVGLLPPFIQFNLLDFRFNPGWLEIHFPPLNCPMGSELKINWYTASFAIDQLVQCLSYRCLEGCSICSECLGYHAIPSFPMAFTIFRRMLLIFLWDVSAWPLV